MANKTIAYLTNYFQTARGFEQCLQKLQILSVENGKCLAKIKIEEYHCNSKAAAHGGFIAMLIHTGSFGATVCEKWRYIPGFTTNLDLNFLNIAKIGDEVVIEANILKMDKNEAFVKIYLKSIKGDTIAFGNTITKSLAQADADHLKLIT